MSKTIGEWLVVATKQLESAHIPTARLDSLVLLADALAKDKAWILANQDFELNNVLTETLSQQLNRRTKREPLAYIRGHQEFYGRRFNTNPSVLIPRPESEQIIELLLTLNLPDSVSIIDVGTGSGALGISATLELSKAGRTTSLLVLTDIDPQCLEVARLNAAKYSVSAIYLETNLLSSAPCSTVVLANLPYVPDTYNINEEAANEPKSAIFGGPDGLELYRELFRQVHETTSPKPTYILTESLPFQHDTLASIAAEHEYFVAVDQYFIQVFTHMGA